MKHFCMALVAAALCFLGVVFSAPKAEAYLTNDTADSIYAVHGADALAYAKSLFGQGSDHFICFIASSSSTPVVGNGIPSFYFFFFNSDSDVIVSGNSESYLGGLSSGRVYKLNSSNGSSYWSGSYRNDTGQFSYLSDMMNATGPINILGVGSLYWYYVDAQGVDLYYNDVLVNPSWSSPDSFYVRPEGWNITYLCLPTDDSPRGNYNFLSTLEYTVRVTVDRNDINSYSVNIPSLPYWSVSVDTLSSGNLSYTAQNTGQFSLEGRYKVCKLYPDPYLVPSETEISSSEFVCPQELIRINLNDLLTLFQREHPDNALTLNDLLNPLHVEFIDVESGNVAYTGDIDYSSFHDHDPFIPKGTLNSSIEPDWTLPPEEQDEDQLLDYLRGMYAGSGVAFKSAYAPDLGDEPEISDFDFSFTFDADISESAGFVRTFFDKIIAAAGLSGFLTIVIAIALASWFIFGPMR